MARGEVRRVEVVGDTAYALVQEILKDSPTKQTLARRLGLSENTVRSHLMDLHRLCDVSSRGELILRLMRREIQLVPRSGMTLSES